MVQKKTADNSVLGTRSLHGEVREQQGRGASLSPHPPPHITLGTQKWSLVPEATSSSFPNRRKPLQKEQPRSLEPLMCQAPSWQAHCHCEGGVNQCFTRVSKRCRVLTPGRVLLRVC